MKFYPVMLLLLLVVLAVRCNKESSGEPASVAEFAFTFNENEEGWVAGFADLPVDFDSAIYELSAEVDSLPATIQPRTRAFRLTGHNRSDDLFMFIKKQLSGLTPNATYQVVFEVSMGSQYPENSVGIGGSPGASLFLKAGATASEPQVITQNGYYRLNVDKGDQSNGGEAVQVLGNAAIPGDQYTYQLIQRTNATTPVLATVDAEGKLWILVGTDSGFEGLTRLYYDKISVRLTETRRMTQ